MARQSAHAKPSVLKANPACSPEREINILLLGQTGVGKTTFINALGNYVVNDTLEAAVNDELQAVISSSFTFTDQDTNDEKTIVIGKEDPYEKFKEIGLSCTQQCRSFVFPIGDRNLRLIDAPGIGDTRGLDQDTKNFEEILTYISQYEHLNGICILLKPDEQRLNILFRFCVKELLRHLHINATENLIFVFTHTRATFYKPGGTKKLLTMLLDELRVQTKVEVPFTIANTFLLDNEPFRFLALRKNGIQLDSDQTESYTRSWNHSVKEYGRLMAYIVTRPLHAVRDTLSLNEAEQLIRKLTRPIAETAKLIEQNIQLAKEHKQNVLNNPQVASQGIPQNDVRIVALEHPRTVCIGINCCQVIQINNETKVEYISRCHDECYLNGVVQETINDWRIENCTAMDWKTGNCMVCGCSWTQHMHITYEYHTNRTHLDSKTNNSRGTNQQSSLSDIDKRILDLRDEEAKIIEVYTKLSRFLHANAITPLNDDIVEYIRYFIREEQMKNSAGARNADVIAGLEKMMADYTDQIDRFKKALQNQIDPTDPADELKPEDIFPLVGTLYRLPINGEKIRQQVNGLKLSQESTGRQRENFVELPAKAASSQIMLQLKDLMCAK